GGGDGERGAAVGRGRVVVRVAGVGGREPVEGGREGAEVEVGGGPVPAPVGGDGGGPEGVGDAARVGGGGEGDGPGRLDGRGLLPGDRDGALVAGLAVQDADEGRTAGSRRDDRVRDPVGVQVGGAHADAAGKGGSVGGGLELERSRLGVVGPDDGGVA